MENTLVRFPYMEVITSKMHKLKKKDIILDTITIRGLLNDGCLDKKVDYQIHVVDDNIVIYPMENYEKYLLKYDRAASADKVVLISNLLNNYEETQKEKN